jgi:hypothetical protein
MEQDVESDRVTEHSFSRRWMLVEYRECLKPKPINVLSEHEVDNEARRKDLTACRWLTGCC